MQEENKSLGVLENMQFEWEIFISSPVAYITVDFKKMVSDLFQAGCALVESNISREKWGYQNSFET